MDTKILFILGTRPEAIKMAPVIKAIQHMQNMDARVCITAQHREMLDQVLDFFHITPHFDLNLMRPGQNLFSLTADILQSLKPVLDSFNPHFSFVHGDTTTTLAGALASFYAGVKVCHVEAGLRTYNMNAPFPEEMNRQVVSRLAAYHFASTPQAKQNLLNEGINEENILVTGNTVIDALKDAVKKVSTLKDQPEIEMLKKLILPGKPIVLVTGHRRENFGQGFLDICSALKEISEHNDVQIIYPVHLNPNVQQPVRHALGAIKNIQFIEPLSYPAFVWLMEKSHIILTDSGGIQEEAPSLGKPVLVMREVTERPEAVSAGTVRLVGTDREKIITCVGELLTNKQLYEKMSSAHNPYGDGNAAERIAEFIKQHIK